MYFVDTVHDTNGVLRYRPNHKMPNSMVMSLSQCNWFVTDIPLICIPGPSVNLPASTARVIAVR